MERSDAGLRIETLALPGQWMSDAELEKLHGQLCALSRACLGEVPDYGIYLRSREPYRNRIITVLRTTEPDRIVAFSAMLLWNVRLQGSQKPQCVMHLGLVLVTPEFRGKKMMYALYHRPLLRFYLRRFLRPFWITSTTMEPVIVGSVADSFSQVHPHYSARAASQPSAAHREIARTFFREHGHEIGVWSGAALDEHRFVIRDSSLGACRSLMMSFEATAKYRVDECNEFCRKTLDYSRGDEILQVGRVDFATLWRSFWWILSKARRRLLRAGAGQRR
jgi:hypothetical protein